MSATLGIRAGALSFAQWFLLGVSDGWNFELARAAKAVDLDAGCSWSKA